MANNSRVIDAGAVTAYGAAVAGGYRGTYEQWCAGMADFGKNVTEVSEKAEQVAENAAAVEEARQEVEEDKEIVDGAIADIQAAKADALAGIETKKDEALQAIEGAGSTQTWNVNNAGETQLAAVNAAGVVMTTSVNNAGTAQVEAIRAEGNMQYGRATEEANRAEEQAELAGNSATAASEAAQTATSMAEDASASEENASASAAAAAASAEAAANASALEVKTITDVPIASFSDGADEIPIKGMTVNVDPVQDLHGYDNPWPAGGGVNIFDSSTLIHGYFSGNTNITPSEAYRTAKIENLPAGTYTITIFWNYGTPKIIRQWSDGGETIIGLDSTSYTFTTNTTADFLIDFRNQNTTDITGTVNVQISAGSSPATSFAPYENNCPITGWTGANVDVTGINSWDEEWEVGRIDTTTGNNVVSTTQIRAKNYIPVKSGSSYYIHVPEAIWVMFYKHDKTLITSGLPTGSQIAGNARKFGATTTDRIIAIPLDCGYIRFYCQTSYGTTYGNDISINYPSTDHDYHAYDGHVYELTFPDAAGTVYGAKLINEGTETWKLRVDHAEVDMGTLSWARTDAYDKWYFRASVSGLKDVASRTMQLRCSAYRTVSDGRAFANCPDKSIYNLSSPNLGIAVLDSSYSAWEQIQQALSGVQLVYELANPIEYTLTGEVVETLLGVNNIWADTGNIAELKYRAMFNTNLIKALIAPVLPSMVADTALAVNDFRIVGDTLYIVTAPIASGGTLTVGTNCRATTVGEQITALLNA